MENNVHTEEASAILENCFRTIKQKAEKNPYLVSAIKKITHLNERGICDFLEVERIIIRHPDYLPIKNGIIILNTHWKRIKGIENLGNKIHCGTRFMREVVDECKNKFVSDETLRIDVLQKEKTLQEIMEDLNIRQTIPDIITERVRQLVEQGLIGHHMLIVGFSRERVTTAVLKKGVVEVETSLSPRKFGIGIGIVTRGYKD